jgi:hypothetical protein
MIMAATNNSWIDGDKALKYWYVQPPFVGAATGGMLWSENS